MGRGCDQLRLHSEMLCSLAATATKAASSPSSGLSPRPTHHQRHPLSPPPSFNVTSPDPAVLTTLAQGVRGSDAGRPGAPRHTQLQGVRPRVLPGRAGGRWWRLTPYSRQCGRRGSAWTARRARPSCTRSVSRGGSRMWPSCSGGCRRWAHRRTW